MGKPARPSLSVVTWVAPSQKEVATRESQEWMQASGPGWWPCCPVPGGSQSHTQDLPGALCADALCAMVCCITSNQKALAQNEGQGLYSYCANLSNPNASIQPVVELRLTFKAGAHRCAVGHPSCSAIWTKLAVLRVTNSSSAVVVRLSSSPGAHAGRNATGHSLTAPHT